LQRNCRDLLGDFSGLPPTHTYFNRSRPPWNAVNRANSFPVGDDALVTFADIWQEFLHHAVNT
jgi:hypothetical protein